MAGALQRWPNPWEKPGVLGGDIRWRLVLLCQSDRHASTTVGVHVLRSGVAALKQKSSS